MGETAELDVDRLGALPVGTTIGGYGIRRIIGHGGFGITYAAYNGVTRKDVAIKEFFPSSMVRRDGNSRLIYSKVNAETIGWALRKFEETTTTLCGLKHPNIVQVHDYVPANDTGYMIMELLEGQTLEQWLEARRQPPSLEELRPLVDPVMEALGYVHGLGLIHRDIAPDNILITREGRPVLIDFGSVSRDLSDARQKAMSGTIGTSKRYYTAPEQARAKARPTPEADIYSMGAVLYRALSGERPADGQDRLDTIFYEKRADPYAPLVKRVPPGCTPRAAQAIDTALAFKTELRQHKIADLSAALAPAAATTVVSRPPTAKWLAASVFAVVLAALGGALAGMHFAKNDNREGKAALDHDRSVVEADRADVAQQRREVAAAKGENDRRAADIDTANADIAKQRDALASTKAENDRRGAEIDAANTDIARQRSEIAAAKAEIDKDTGTSAAATGDLAKQREDFAAAVNAEKGREIEAQADLGRQRDALSAERSRLATQLSDIQGQLDDANRRRDEAENATAQLRGQAGTDKAKIAEQDAQLQANTETIDWQKKEIDRLTHVTPNPVPPSPERNLQRRARDAIASFYDKHSYSDGGNLDDLAALYPSDQDITVNGASKSGRAQIAALEAYFKEKRYTSFDIRIEADTLDFTNCQSSDNCIVKGRTDASFRTSDNPILRTSTSNFCLRLNLQGSPKVVSEAAVRLGKDPSCD